MVGRRPPPHLGEEVGPCGRRHRTCSRSRSRPRAAIPPRRPHHRPVHPLPPLLRTASRQPFVLTALSPGGATLWSRRFASLANQRGDLLLVAADPAGPVAVAGYGYASGSSIALVLGFDAQGNATFAREYRSLAPALSMAYGPDHEIVLAVPGGSAEFGGTRVEGAMVVDLAP